MPREIEDRKKRKALRKLRKAADLAEQGLGPPLSDWEKEFLAELEDRIETYGSAFADPGKGDLTEPLSALQSQKLKEIDRKARGKAPSGFRTRKQRQSPVENPKDTIPQTDAQPEDPVEIAPVTDVSPGKRRAFRVIEGGKG